MRKIQSRLTSSKIVVAYFKGYKKHITLFLCVLSVMSIGVFLGLDKGGLKGQYYANTNWEGDPAVSRIDKTPCLKGVQGYDILSIHTYSVKWTGWIAINQSGTYRFATNSDDGSYLRINGKEVVNNGGVHGVRKAFGEIPLEKGVYSIEIFYFQEGGESFMQMLWTPPGESESPIPVKVLFATCPDKGRIILRKSVVIFSWVLKILWGSLLLCVGLIIVMRYLKSYKTFFMNSIWILILCIFTFGITYCASVDYTSYDPLGNLLTTQSIIKHGTLKLDPYPRSLVGYRWHLSNKNEHIYYSYPIGTPLFAVPFVWLANLCGAEMSYNQDEAALQNTLSALTTTLSCFLIYLICRCYLPLAHSIFLSSVFVFGSSIASTMGTALWSINFTIVFILSSLLILIYDECQKIHKINPYLLGFFLFSAYLCRPTASIFVFVIFLYILLKKRPVFIKLALMYFLFFGAFVLFSWLEYQQILPDYYLPKQLGTSKPLWSAIYGVLLSPARGLFVYIPYLALTLVGALYLIKQLYRNAFFWITISWFALHVILISKNEMWWGGGCFGSRMFTDAFPGLILLTVLVWRKALRLQSLLQRRILLSIFIFLAAVSIFINTYQGLYNTYTVDWGDPWQHLFDWKYPQFLASHRLLAERDIEEQEKSLQCYTIGETIFPSERKAIFSSWYFLQAGREGAFRWSRGKSAKILFKLEPFDASKPVQLFLEIRVGSYLKQEFDVLFNRKKLDTIVHEKFSPSTYTFPINELTLKVSRNTINEYNTIEFLIPDAINPASVPSGRDRRALGISVWQIRLYAENSK